MGNWTQQYTPPENINGGVEYEKGHNPTTDTFNVPINNSFWAAEEARKAVAKSKETAAEVTQFEQSVTNRVNGLAEQIVDGEGTAISLLGNNALRVYYSDGKYYYVDTAGITHELPIADLVARHTTGKYTGTDTYGWENPNSITLDFPAKLVIIGSKISGNGAQAILFPEVGVGLALLNLISLTPQYLHVSRDGNTISWYSYNSGVAQMNAVYEYQYTAFG